MELVCYVRSGAKKKWHKLAFHFLVPKLEFFFLFIYFFVLTKEQNIVSVMALVVCKSHPQGVLTAQIPLIHSYHLSLLVIAKS